jgi:hypothetical protein
MRGVQIAMIANACKMKPTGKYEHYYQYGRPIVCEPF